MIRPKIIVIAGPTASGKTELSLKLARKFNGEIISADSRQVYRGLDIGSGKVKLENNKARGVRHYLIDVASPGRTFTVAQYQRLGQKAMAAILKQDKLPFVVGGSGLYIESLVYDLHFPEVKPDLALRKKLVSKSAAELHQLLKKLDPNRAKTIDRNNPRRFVRAIEIAKALGSIPKLQSKSKYDILFLGVKISDQRLRQNINQRLDKRLLGIIREIKNLRKRGISWQRLISLGLEYRYVSKYILRELSRQEAIARLKTAIWHYARRQYTWFRRLPVQWVEDEKQAQSRIQSFLFGFRDP